MAEYYYLISSLPKLQPNLSELRGIDVMDLFDLIERNLTKEDRVIYQCLIYQHDNRNLLHQIFNEYHHLEVPEYKQPSVISETIMKNYRRNYSFLPDYMIQFLLDNAGVFGSYTPADIELKLRNYFFDFISREQSEFLVTYYEWQYRLEQTLAEFSQKHFDFLPNSEILDSNYPVPITVKTAVLDREKLLSELKPLIDSGKYAGVEKLIDTYYWEFGEYWTDTFSSNAVFSYTIKLLRTVRWQHAITDTELKKKRILSIVEHVKTGLDNFNLLKT